MNKENSCYGCKDRTIGCHSNCEKYMNFKKNLNDFNKTVRKQKDKEYILANTKFQI